jgi:hypothetical protein
LFKTTVIIFLLLLSCVPLQAQRGNVWCFGDSAALDFNGGAPVPGASSVVSRGSCVSIADTNGDLMFYGNTDGNNGGYYSGLVWNRNHELMMEGDSISGTSWYQEMIIVPNPADDSSYYLFSVGVTYQFGLMYSIIDMRGDGGLGAVTQKNMQLLNFLMVDCILAIKHGNGRDWWLLVRPSPVGSTPNNTWNTFLINTAGITAMPNQFLGSLNSTNGGRLTISPDGARICFVNLGGMIELYDFERCTGLLVSTENIEPELSIGPYPYYWLSEFSSSGQYLYVSSTTQTVSKLWQYDTWSANILTTKTLVWQTPGPPFTAGALKRGPDNKIYFSCAWVPPNGSNSYPYDSTEYFTENMNLSVINSPDSAGLACDFQPWSFYLGGKRTYWGLPNNPDYDLPALTGSPCDTLVGVSEIPVHEQQTNLYVYYSPQWQTAFINANQLKGTSCKLQVFDVMGNLVFEESKKFNPPYYTKNLNCTSFAKGMYVVTLEAGGQRLVKKFVVE